MRNRLLSFVVFAVAVTSANAQDRIAVLDTELPKGMDAKVIIPVTEKIMEEFVRSKRFTVLDRSFIQKTLSELEFSASELTAGDSAKLATIGGFLKATYIVVSTVQRLDDTYFLSAKMIEVKTGVITAQSSVDRAGSSSVLIGMAGDLGRALVADALGKPVPSARSSRTEQPAPTQAPTQAPEAAKPARQPRQDKPQGTRFSTLSADIGSGTIGEITGASYGASMMIPSGVFYASFGASLIDAESDPYLYSGYYYSDSYSDIDIYLGAGLDLAFGSFIVYAGPRIAFSVVDLSVLNSDGSEYGSTTWKGASYGFELGADMRLGSFFVGLRYAGMQGDLENEDTGALSTMENYSIQLRLGIVL